MISHNYIHLLFLLSCSYIIFTGCMGGTSETGNARTANITGCIAADGKGASNATVLLVHESFIPSSDSLHLILSGKSDAAGRFSFNDVPWGSYYLNAQLKDNKCIAGPFVVDKSEKALAPESLSPTSQISLPFTDTSSLKVVYIKGSTEIASIGNGRAIFYAAPAGKVTIVEAEKYFPVSIYHKAYYKSVNSVEVTSSPFDSLSAYFYNTAPRIIGNHEGRVAYTLDSIYSDTVFAVDAEHRQLRFKLTSCPSGMMIDSLYGVIFWRLPVISDSVTYRIGVEVVDPDGESARASWDLTVFGKPPHSPISGPAYGFVGEPIQFSLDTIIISDTNDIYTVSWGDGDTSRVSSDAVFHIWNIPGNYTIVLNALVNGPSDSMRFLGTVDVIISDSVDTASGQLEYYKLLCFTNNPRPADSLRMYEPVWALIRSTPCAGSPAYQTVGWGDGTIDTFVRDTLFKHHYVAAGTYVVSAAARCEIIVDTMAVWIPFDTVTVLRDTLFDTAPPVIKLFEDTQKREYHINDTFIEPGYTAWDDVDRDCTGDVIISSVDMTDGVFENNGMVTILYFVTDSRRNEATMKRTVDVLP